MPNEQVETPAPVAPQIKTIRTKPKVYKPWTDAKLGKVMVGIENELMVDTTQQQNEVIAKAKCTDFVRVGYDCSLRGTDVECRTAARPFTKRTLNIVSNYFDSNKAVVKQPPQFPANNDRHYGLHVNVSGFEDKTYLRAQKFCVDNKDNVKELAGRRSDRWCPYVVSGMRNKSCCVNVRGNGVAEFRIFCATTDKVMLKYRVQFSVALCAMCVLCEDQRAEPTWDILKEFVAAKSNKYPELHTYMQSI